MHRYNYHLREFFNSINHAWWIKPKDRSINQYRDWVLLHQIEKLSDAPQPEPVREGIPAWAERSRQGWLEVRRVVKWWLENRQSKNGEFGCNLGDDSVLYSKFADLPFMERSEFTDKVMSGAVNLLERAEKNNLLYGINKKYTDTLHAYEEGMNLRATISRWYYGNPVYLERCMESQKTMAKLTIMSEDGNRHLPDTHFESKDLKTPRKLRADSAINCLMWHTGMVVADYNRNPEVLQIIGEWMDSFAKKMKPGHWVEGIDPKTGKVTNYNPKRPLLGGAASQGSLWMWMYNLTGKKLYIEPFLHYFRKGAVPLPADMYAGDFIASGAHKELTEKELEKLAKKGERTFTLPLYLKEDASFLSKVITGVPRMHTAQIDTLHDARRWSDMTATAEPSNDRVLLGRIMNFVYQAYLGGVNGRNRFTSAHAASWKGFGTDYAALILKNQKNQLKAALYNFSSEKLDGTMTIWALEHGKYKFTAGKAGGNNFKMES
ncbi:MAG: hypothetical protein ACYTFY_23210, partial [Planctomycetota bacterium]|jgi:hypothetical protein